MLFHNSIETPHVAIVGGGVSGSLVAIYLSQNPHFSGKITLFESAPHLTGKGIAYTGTLPYQPLNVIARNMSMWEENSHDFADWLSENGYPHSATDFAPRNLYGQYLRERVEQHLMQNPKVDIVPAEVQNVSKFQDHFQLKTTAGNVEADYVVLALGNAPLEKNNPTGSTRYLNNPWDHSAFEKIKPGEHVLTIGAGLTMVDWAVSLLDKGVKVTAVSRRGLLPRVHLSSPLHLEKDQFPDGGLGEIFRFLKNKLQNEATAERPWQAILDTFRADTTRAWRGLSLEEKRRFMRHLRPYWEVHRHRMPEMSSKKLQAYEAQGLFSIKQSRVQSIVPEGDGVSVELKTKEGGVSKNHYDWVINCTGPDASFPLLNKMAEQGLVKLDLFNMGIDLDERCRCTQSPQILALGNVSRGSFWESTALRELRQQAQIITDELVKVQVAVG